MALPKLRFKEFNDEWKKVKIKDIANVIGGGTPPTETEKFWNGSIQWFTPSEIGKTKYIANSERTISELGLKNSSAKLLPSGTILLTSRATIGEASILLNFGTTNQGFQSLISKNFMDNEFIYYLKYSFEKEMKIKAFGSTFLEISKTNLENINVYITEYVEQEKIAKFLSLLDKKIELQQKKIEALKIYKTGLIQKYFDCKNGKKTKISEILEEFTKKTTENNQYDVISSTKDGLFLQKEYFNRSIASEDNSGYKILKKNQIVFSPQNLWMGNINYNNKYEIGIVSPSYKVFDINKKFDKDYISYLLKTNKAIYYYTINSEQGASIVRRNLNIESFYEINFIIPDIVEQEQKGRLINKISSKIENEENKYKELNKLKKGLLQKMFI